MNENKITFNTVILQKKCHVGKFHVFFNACTQTKEGKIGLDFLIAS